MLLVKDPISFKESILIALEASKDTEKNFLIEFVSSIPSKVGLIRLDTTKEIEDTLRKCIADFKQKKTYFWLREDFKNSLYDVEAQINKKIS